MKLKQSLQVEHQKKMKRTGINFHHWCTRGESRGQDHQLFQKSHKIFQEGRSPYLRESKGRGPIIVLGLRP